MFSLMLFAVELFVNGQPGALNRDKIALDSPLFFTGIQFLVPSPKSIS